MRSTRPRELQFYKAPNGREPFTQWFKTIRDTRAQSSIRSRFIYLEQGISGITVLLVMVFLNCVSMSEQGIVFILPR